MTIGDIIFRIYATGHTGTVEEHSIYGVLGSIVTENVSQECPVKMKILGIPDENAINAKALEMFDYNGLSAGNIIKEVKRILGKD